jgi:hypothetical protein
VDEKYLGRVRNTSKICGKVQNDAPHQHFGLQAIYFHIKLLPIRQKIFLLSLQVTAS